ncbi:odorant receptor 67a-like [Contarinia nasturtii]|uniref:odorant receptor 67a-like n=1 Tax=Contarinia nasturtii TaxID=265458 RepID=UPI0012D41261|nr:odorant receptor 67a-like [Contarinia nasturtii]
MKPIPSLQQMMTWLCLLPPDNYTSVWKKRAYIGFSVVLILMQIITMIASVAFILKNRINNYEETLFAYCLVFYTLAKIYTALVAFYVRHGISIVVSNLTKIYDTDKDEDSFQFLERANDKCEWLLKFYFTRVFSIQWFFHLLTGIGSLLFCMYLDGELNRDHLYEPFHFVLPWNQTTPLGYCGQLSVTLLYFISYFTLNGAFFLIFISMCFHHEAFYEMFQHKLRKLNHPDENGNKKKLLCKIIQFQISIRNWFLYSSEVYAFVIMIELIHNMLGMAIMVFDVEMQAKHFNIDGIFFTTGLSICIGNLFLSCYFGKLASNSYEKMADCLYHDCNWIELPNDLKKSIILMIQMSQKPIFYHGFGIVELNLETFTKFIKTTCSYYMILKTLNDE